MCFFLAGVGIAAQPLPGRLLTATICTDTLLFMMINAVAYRRTHHRGHLFVVPFSNAVPFVAGGLAVCWIRCREAKRLKGVACSDRCSNQSADRLMRDDSPSKSVFALSATA